MAWVTEEEYQAAKQVRAYEYLQTYQPGRLKKTRTRNEWQLQDHDSFKINEITSKWHWKSRGIGGMSALRFLMQVDGMGYTEAVKILCEQTPVYVSRAEPAPRKKPFSLPFPNDSFYRVRRYLNQRGIRDEVLDYCVQLGIRSFPKLKIPHQSHADFCSTDTAGGLDNKKRRYAPRGGVAYRLFLWGFPKGATPPFGTRLCEAKCSVLYALPALP